MTYADAGRSLCSSSSYPTGHWTVSSHLSYISCCLLFWIYFSFIGELCLCVYTCTKTMPDDHGGTGCPGPGTIDGCKLPCGCLEPNWELFRAVGVPNHWAISLASGFPTLLKPWPCKSSSSCYPTNYFCRYIITLILLLSWVTMWTFEMQGVSHVTPVKGHGNHPKASGSSGWGPLL